MGADPPVRAANCFSSIAGVMLTCICGAGCGWSVYPLTLAINIQPMLLLWAILLNKSELHNDSHL